MDRGQLLNILAEQIGKPLAARKAKQTQAARDAYQQIQQGADPMAVLTALLGKLKTKKCKPERDAIRKLCKTLPVPPLRLKWPYPLTKY